MDELAETAAEEQSEAKTHLRSVADRLQANGLATTRSVRLARVSHGIASEAAEVEARLIVMATHAEPPVAQALVGTIAIEVLHRVSVPVLLVGPRVVLD